MSNIFSSGFSLYNQQIIGQTPCYSILPQTLSIPAAASEQISSLSAIIAATATAPDPTVSVHIITDEIFALSLPLKNGVETTNHNGGLSLGAKIGVGLGAGFGAILIILMVWLLFFRNKRGKTLSNTSGISSWVDGTAASTTVPPMGPMISQTWTQKQGNTSYAGEGHITGPGGEQSWTPNQSQYCRAPRDSRPMRPMQMAYQTGGQTMYSELPGVAS